MSAFMQSSTHIDALLTAGIQLSPCGLVRWFWPDFDEEETAAVYEPGPETAEIYERHYQILTKDTAGRVGAMLLAQNRYSLDYRYSEEGIEEPYLFHELPGKVSPLVVLKAITGYEYQACESPDWEMTEAFAFCQELRRLCVTQLAGFEASDGWAIEDRNIFVGSSTEKRRRRP